MLLTEFVASSFMFVSAFCIACARRLWTTRLLAKHRAAAASCTCWPGWLAGWPGSVRSACLQAVNIFQLPPLRNKQPTIRRYASCAACVTKHGKLTGGADDKVV